jgi:quinolinate synthase|tara:strand:+ start:24012 stop:24938 length:927 start_codon:yes stop_codon:yes gene_type:complete
MQLQQAVTENTENLIERVLKLKKQRNAVILVHNYQIPDMYKIADFIGDSLELSKQAAKTDADVIVFCGVKFMAETAKILSPDKTVLIPTLEAGCSLADMASVEQLMKLKKEHPKAAVVSYVNTNADIKALSDVCCTSMNAVKIVNSLPNEEIIFLPDKNLGKYVQSKTKKKIILWEGYCAIHHELSAKMLTELKKQNPDTKIIAHPECQDDVLGIADHICGTGGMAKFAKSNNAQDFIVVTECGMTEKLREDAPDKNFHSFCNICPYMKATTLPLVVNSLENNQHEIILPQEIITKARKALDRMLEFA